MKINLNIKTCSRSFDELVLDEIVSYFALSHVSNDIINSDHVPQRSERNTLTIRSFKDKCITNSEVMV